MALTQKWANAALTNNATIMLDATNEIGNVLKKFDDKHGTSEMKKEADHREQALNAANYMRKRQQYLQQRCA
jgi:hypothetical protein